MLLRSLHNKLFYTITFYSLLLINDCCSLLCVAARVLRMRITSSYSHAHFAARCQGDAAFARARRAHGRFFFAKASRWISEYTEEKVSLSDPLSLV